VYFNCREHEEAVSGLKFVGKFLARDETMPTVLTPSEMTESLYEASVKKEVSDETVSLRLIFNEKPRCWKYDRKSHRW